MRKTRPPRLVAMHVQCFPECTEDRISLSVVVKGFCSIWEAYGRVNKSFSTGEGVLTSVLPFRNKSIAR